MVVRVPITRRLTRSGSTSTDHRYTTDWVIRHNLIDTVPYATYTGLLIALPQDYSIYSRCIYLYTTEEDYLNPDATNTQVATCAMSEYTRVDCYWQISTVNVLGSQLSVTA